MNEERKTRPRHQSPHQRQLDILVTHYVEQVDIDLPKHVRIRKAILEAISDGSLEAGDQIPPEQELSAAASISLGTVQRALRRLADDGALVRKQGHGTYVSGPRREVDELWQLRFIAEDGHSLLPVYNQILDQRVIEERGPWSEALGPDRKGFLQISRSFNVADKFACYSHFIVQVSRFGALQRTGRNQLESVNLRGILGTKLGALTISVTQRIKIELFSDEMCDQLSVNYGTSGLILDAIGHGYGGDAISYHRIWVPPTEYFLDMTQDAIN